MTFGADLDPAIPRAAFIVAERDEDADAVAAGFAAVGFAVTRGDYGDPAPPWSGVVVDAISFWRAGRADAAVRAAGMVRGFAKVLTGDAKGAAVFLIDQRAVSDGLGTRVRRAAALAVIEGLALETAPRVRVNGVEVGGRGFGVRQTPILSGPAPGLPVASASPHDIARAVVATVALRSMTGQTVTLNADRDPRRAPLAEILDLVSVNDRVASR